MESWPHEFSTLPSWISDVISKSPVYRGDTWKNRRVIHNVSSYKVLKMAINLGKRKIIPQKMSFKALEDSIIRDLSDFDEYSFLLESVLEQKKSKLSKKIDEEVRIDEEYDEDEIVEFYLDDLNQIGAVFPSFFRKSLLISLYSLLEHELQKLCKKIGSA